MCYLPPVAAPEPVIIGWSRCLSCGMTFDLRAGDEIHDDCPDCRARHERRSALRPSPVLNLAECERDNCGSTYDVRPWHYPLTDSSEDALLCQACRFEAALAFDREAFGDRFVW